MMMGDETARDREFNAVISAVARRNRRLLDEARWEQQRIDAKQNDPKHIKAVAKRRKRKRGGPK